MNFTAFLGTLPYMAMGMLGVFIVTMVLINAVLLLNIFTNR